jgi:serine protease AprX
MMAAAFSLLLAPLILTVHEKEMSLAKAAVSSPPAAPAPAPVAPPVVRAASPAIPAQAGERSPYIVQAATVDIARSAVLRVGGVVTGELGIIRAVGASLDDDQLMALHAADVPGLRVFQDTEVKASSVTGALPETYYPTELAASNLHVGGVTGAGVTVAVLDSGLWAQHGPLQSSSSGNSGRILAQYDVLLAQQNPSAYPIYSTYSANIGDPYGHGTHVSSIIGSSGIATTGKYRASPRA